MRYAVLIGDGMADYPLRELEGRTPLQAAETPNMDRLARMGTLGLVRTIPSGWHPGSDVANLVVLGYDPDKYYTGRGPLEAASMGIRLNPEDVAFRCNLVHLEMIEGSLIMADFTAGHIPTEAARKILECIDQDLGGGPFSFYGGVSYRHLMVWKNGIDTTETTPPHDITGEEIEPYLPKGEGAEELCCLMEASQRLLISEKYRPLMPEDSPGRPNSIWLWGQGRPPRMPSFSERYGITGGLISAVDLIKGIGLYAGFKPIEVPGATGYYDTDYKGKADKALEALRHGDFIYIHVEAPDEAGHSGDVEEKIRAIERFDIDVVGTMLKGLSEVGPFRILVLPDHPTPIPEKTHTADPVPFAAFSTDGVFKGHGAERFDEPTAAKTGFLIEEGMRLIHGFMKGSLEALY